MQSLNGAKIAVAGAGAFGSAVALRLAQAGWTVTVFDPSPPGVNASGVGGRHAGAGQRGAVRSGVARSPVVDAPRS